MIVIDRQAYRAMWGIIGIVLASGWAVYGLTGTSHTLLVVMVVATLLLSGGTAVLVRARQGTSGA